MTEGNTAGGSLSLTLLDGADVAPLFSPVSVTGLKLRNRLVMAPLTREFSPDGIPGADVAAYYARRASSLGLLITEGTYVDEGSGGSSRVPRFFGERSLAGWRKVADAVHAEGGAIFPQLWHTGAVREPGSGPFPSAPVISPSGVNAAGTAVGSWRRPGSLTRSSPPTPAPPARPRTPGSTESTCNGAERLPARPVPLAAYQPAGRRLRR